MARFLFASIAVPAHTTNPLPFAARLVERGHQVDWYAGRAFHDRIAAVGARPVAYGEAVDFSEGELYDHFPHLRDLTGAKVISRAFAEIFVGQAVARAHDLGRHLADRPADVMLCDELSFGVGLVSEAGGPPWATFGDGPLPFPEPDTPPFGPGLLPMAGPIGRLRNRVVAAAGRLALFRPPSGPTTRRAPSWASRRRAARSSTTRPRPSCTCRAAPRRSSTRGATCRRTSTGSVPSDPTRPRAGSRRRGGTRSSRAAARWCT